MTTLSLKLTSSINASPSKVWNVLTDPEEIKKYFFGTNTITDWKPGSSIKFTGVWEGKPYEDKGFILEAVREKILKYSYWSPFSGTEDKPENYQTVSFQLSSDGLGTLLTLTQENILTEESKTHSESNWKGILEVMKKQIES